MRTDIEYSRNIGRIMIFVSPVMIVLMLLDLPLWWAFVPVGILLFPFTIGLAFFVLRSVFAPSNHAIVISRMVR